MNDKNVPFALLYAVLVVLLGWYAESAHKLIYGALFSNYAFTNLFFACIPALLLFVPLPKRMSEKFFSKKYVLFPIIIILLIIIVLLSLAYGSSVDNSDAAIVSRIMWNSPVEIVIFALTVILTLIFLIISVDSPTIEEISGAVFWTILFFGFQLVWICFTLIIL